MVRIFTGTRQRQETTESGENGAITLRRMCISEYVGHTTIFSRVLSTACC